MFVRRLLPILCGLALASGPARAAEPTEPAGPAEPAHEEAPPTPPQTPPSTAFAALVRATAAYEYGDMVQVVEAVRPVAEGTLPANTSQRARALRYLGVGLFLTNRALGAENAFSEWLRIDPNARLDPTSTRPEVVAFFENIRHQQVKREMSSRTFAWNLLPPAGQFQNGQKTKGWILAGVELTSAASAATSWLLVKSWKHADTTYDHDNLVRGFTWVNWVSGGLLVATYIYGVIDGLVNYYRTPDETTGSLSWKFSPQDGALRLTF
jgi:hypothetical protein